MDVNQLLQEVNAKPKKGPEPASKKNDESFDNVMDSISKNWSPTKEATDSQKIEQLKAELRAQKEIIKALESNREGFSKNEEKILAAIRSESLSQGTDTPQISSRIFRSIYKVSSDYFRPSIENLLSRGIIERTQIKFAGKIPTYRWRIL
jgi:small-conductance mechanosensitive channel